MQNHNILTHDADSAIIVLHGLGSSGENFVILSKQMGLAKTNFILPDAPIKPISINHGATMQAWYDIYFPGLVDKEDEIGIKESRDMITQLINEQLALGIPAHRIILSGFSQGGAMALYTGLRCQHALGGIIAMSSYQVLAKKLPDERHHLNQNIPIFMSHGIFDNIVPLALARQAYLQMQDLAYKPTWVEYPITHTISQEVMLDVKNFITGILGYSKQVA